MATTLCPPPFPVVPVRLEGRSCKPTPELTDRVIQGYGERALVVRRTGGEPKTRFLTNFASAGAGVSFGCHNHDLDTLVTGLVKRVFLHSVEGEFVPLELPNRQLFTRRLRPFRDAYFKIARGLTPLSHDEFVATCDSRKRRIYEMANEELKLDGLLERDAWLQTFVKFEKLNFTAKANPDPRVIQPRSPKFNICVGAYLRPLEAVMYKLVTKMYKEPTILKGKNALERAAIMREKWERFSDPVAVDIDVSRMDEHFHVHALRFMHALYNRHYNSRELRALLKRQINQIGRARAPDGYVKYRVQGRKASGEMDTSLATCVIMCAMIYAYFFERGFVLPDAPAHRFALSDDGDDGVLMLERRDLPVLDEFVEWFGQMGFPIKLGDPVDRFERIEFCQTRPVFDGTQWVLLRNPRVCLDKDLCTTKPVPNAKAWNLLRNSVAQCGLAYAGNMPVFCEFYRFLARGAGSRVDKDMVMTGFKYLAAGMDARGPVTDAARLSFWEAFDWPVPLQLDYEAHYRSLVPRFVEPADLSYCPQHPGAMGSVC